MECNRLPRERERTVFELAYIEQLSNAVDLMLVAQAQCPIGGVLYHFVQFGRPLSPAEVVWTKSVPCPLSTLRMAEVQISASLSPCPPLAEWYSNPKALERV